MSDDLTKRVRFRLEYASKNWKVLRSYAPRKAAEGLPPDKWANESYHPKFKDAALHMLDRLITEGYKPKGLEALVERVEEAERRVIAWCEAHEHDPNAELEAIP